MAKKYHQITGTESVGSIAKMYGTTPQALLNENPGVSNLSAGAYIRIPLTKGGPKGFYTTGENERKTVIINGQTVRMGPNSTITPSSTKTPSLLDRIKSFGNTLLGGSNEVESPSGTTSVQGSIQGGGKNARVAQQGINWGQAGAGVNAIQPVGAPLGGVPTRPGPATSPEGEPNPYPSLNQARGGQHVIQPYSGYEPSPQLEGWYDNISSGSATPVTSNVFNELTLINQNGGIPRDAAIQYADSQLRGMGYVYNPTTKRYEMGAPESQQPKSPADMTQAEQAALYQANRDQRTGESYIRGTARYGQQSYYRGGKLINRDTRNIRTKRVTRNLGGTTSTEAGSNTVSGQGEQQSIWRIG